jgi:enoyl-CoA hydratase
MTLACDIRIATKKAFFAAAYINIGLGGADMGSSYLLPRIIGVTRANRYLLTGDNISATEAERIGLVNEIVSEEKLSETVLSLADTMCSKNPLGLMMTKEAINQNLNAGSLEEAILFEDRNQSLISFSLDKDQLPGQS